jgi:hypothetical protein
MDGKLALLYFIIVAIITFSYVEENVGRMKHAITAPAIARVQAATE